MLLFGIYRSERNLQSIHQFWNPIIIMIWIGNQEIEDHQQPNKQLTNNPLWNNIPYI